MLIRSRIVLAESCYCLALSNRLCVVDVPVALLMQEEAATDGYCICLYSIYIFDIL